MKIRVFFIQLIFIALFAAPSFPQKPYKQLMTNKAAINSIDISPDGSLIASGGDDNFAILTEFVSGNIIYNLSFTSRVIAVEFSKDGDYLLSASKNEISILELSTKKLSRVTYFSTIRNLHFGSVPSEIFVNGEFEFNHQKGIFYFDVTSKKYRLLIEQPDARDFKISNSGNLLYIMLSNRIVEFDINASVISKTFNAFTSFSSFDLFPDNRFIGSATDKGQIVLFNLSDRSNNVTTGSSSEPMIVKIGKDNSYIVYAQKNSLKINKLVDHTYTDSSTNQVRGKKLLSFTAHPINSGDLPINDFVISSDGKFILAANKTATITIWNNPIGEMAAETTENITALEKNTEQIPQLEVSENQSETDLTDEFIYKYNKGNIDRELAMRPELFTPKGEFEKSAEFEVRKKEAAKYRESVIDFYRQKYIEQIKFQRYLDSTAVVRKEELLKEKIRNSYIEIALTIQNLGTYEADNEYFPIKINGKNDILKMQRNDAMTFKPNYLKARIIGHQQLLEDGITMDTFNIYVIHPISNKVYLIGAFKKPLYIEDANADLRNLNTASIDQNITILNPEIKNTNNDLNELDREFIRGLKDRKNYGLFISISDYLDPSINDLDFPNKDADNLFRTLNAKYGFKLENSIILKDPTRAEIMDAFDKINEKATQTDQVLIFYAGHGLWDEKMQQGFWLPRDAKRDSKAQWISNGTIRDYIRGINSKHTLLIADACFSGGIFKERTVFNSSMKYAIELYKLPSRKAITSGAMNTVPDQSVFIQYLVKKLNENPQQILTSEGLFSGIRDAVINNSTVGQIPQYGEIRESGDEGGDFIFIVE